MFLIPVKRGTVREMLRKIQTLLHFIKPAGNMQFDDTSFINIENAFRNLCLPLVVGCSNTVVNTKNPLFI